VKKYTFVPTERVCVCAFMIIKLRPCSNTNFSCSFKMEMVFIFRNMASFLEGWRIKKDEFASVWQGHANVRNRKLFRLLVK
jgi:hypothetical protein